MMNIKKILQTSISLLFIFNVNCAMENINPAVKDILIYSNAPANPVIVGLPVNPMLSITVYLPQGSNEINPHFIEGTLNASALNDVQKIEVYFTDNEPLFNPVNIIASFPPSEAFSIPINVKLKPGMHHFWLSVTLKETANPDHFVELHITKLKDISGKDFQVAENPSTFKKYIGVAVRKSGDNGVNTYRIPGITITDKGTLISVYDIRYNNSSDLPGNIDVGMSRSTDGGKTWQPMKTIIDMGAPHENNGVGDPSILFDPITKKIWVAALWSKGNRSIAGSGPGLTPDETGQLVVVSSSDDGLTWSLPFSITPQVKNPVWNIFFNGPGNGMTMSDGKLVFAAQYWDEKRMPYSTIIYSDDHGNGWKSGVGAKSNTSESQVIETTPGVLMLNMRDNRGGFRSVATTTDLGKSWVEHSTSYNTLQYPVCMGSLLKTTVNLQGTVKEVVLFSNPNSSYARINITVKASLDLGETWPVKNQLLIDERKCFGYSALTKIDDNTVGLLYEGTRDLYFVRIPITDIIK
jgi:sialidase-1